MKYGTTLPDYGDGRETSVNTRRRGMTVKRDDRGEKLLGKNRKYTLRKKEDRDCKKRNKEKIIDIIGKISKIYEEWKKKLA